MATDLGYLPRLQSREEFVDYLEGYAHPTAAELAEGKSTRKLLKTYMLETARHDHDTPELASVFPDRVHLERLDDTMFRIEDADHDGKVVGLLEALDDRHPVFYTRMAAAASDKWVRQVVDWNPWLDRLWLSSPILFELWQYVQRRTPAHRYVRLGFEHEARYEAASDLERRKSKVTLAERLSELEEKLPFLLEHYDPLHSLVHLQIPGSERGGHLIFHDGYATNRSTSFLDHRAIISLVLRLYRGITEHAENKLWVDTTEVGQDGLNISGAPVTIRFNEPLDEVTFNRFVQFGLKRRTSKLRIGGYMSRRGPTKVHMSAIDRHLWQPFLLEATSKQILCVLPRGTCGNTVHRLVTNVQR